MRQLLLMSVCAATFALAPAALAQDGEETCAPLQAVLAGEAPPPRARSRPIRASDIWTEANDAARQRPERGAFSAARYVYTYSPGALYELYANPDFISTIMLEEGEALEDIAAGDTARWQVNQTTQGTLDGRAILLVKPSAAGLRTNIVLVTNRRTYLVEAVSHAGEAYSAQIAWCYPDASAHAASVAGAVQLNFDYRVRTTRGARPAWSPTRVFDDGRRTWIEFGEDTEATDLPPLFVITPEGAELTNYRIDGRRYMVDRVFDAAELRLGVRAPTIVRIERTPVAPRARRPRRGRS